MLKHNVKSLPKDKVHSFVISCRDVPQKTVEEVLQKLEDLDFLFADDDTPTSFYVKNPSLKLASIQAYGKKLKVGIDEGVKDRTDNFSYLRSLKKVERDALLADPKSEFYERDFYSENVIDAEAFLAMEDLPPKVEIISRLTMSEIVKDVERVTDIVKPQHQGILDHITRLYPEAQMFYKEKGFVQSYLHIIQRLNFKTQDEVNGFIVGAIAGSIVGRDSAEGISKADVLKLMLPLMLKAGKGGDMADAIKKMISSDDDNKNSEKSSESPFD